MDRKVLSGIMAFVEERRKEEGGYSATPLLAASVEDTYPALRILEVLGGITGLGKTVAPFRRDKSLRKYIAGAAKTGWISARTTFQTMYCASLVGLSPKKSKVLQYIEQRLKTTSGLGERYHCARILRETLAFCDLTVWPMAKMSGFRKWRTARELWMKLYLRQGCSPLNPSLKDEMVAWLQACQNSDGGFGFLPMTTSYIENCLTCLRALALLGARPLDPGACLRFALACRTGRGGFSRNPGAAPFLDATCHAVAVFSLIEGVPAS